ncbi:D-arabinono-1,4-lactone oxidase [Cystobacter ferrugineus]|uniref:D-arabinono-1,4-lactone oxidase n=1 Tax=Cystobacter ferrugineus TaxID=83449 RepID=UPI001C9DD6CA|nr:D-arabinono-1,4-lactone oxidase [Cystobacter ferrugineus]
MAPIIGYLLFVAVYAFFWTHPRTARRFWLYLGFANTVAVMLFIFDSVLLVESFQRASSPGSEKILYVVAMSLLLILAGLGLWVRLRVNDFLNPPLDPRFEHPRTEGELILLVKKARAYGVQVRVRGSAHCVDEGIYTDDSGPHINVQLDRYNQILGWEESSDTEGPLLRVTVQAGCHLGVDPNNPLSNRKNSLLWQLDKYGWALPDLGGISHQTVGGFISTGSMGGTLKHNLGEAIMGIRIIDGTGRARDLAPNPGDSKDEEHNPFYAAGVSMGLLGIISTVTLTCRPRYDIEGTQVTSSASQLFKPGQAGSSGKGLQELFNEDHYTRMLWWPQQGVNKVEHWKANRISEPEQRLFKRMARSCSKWRTRRFERRPFVSTPLLLQWLIVHPFLSFLAKSDPLPFNQDTRDLVRNVLGIFVKEGKKGEKTFQDSWHRGLPMDDQISDKHMPTAFTELFIHISHIDRLMEILDSFFNPESKYNKGKLDEREWVEGMGRTGSYAIEIYPGHESRFWMSPCYKQNCVRVDVFWFRTPKDSMHRDRFFKQFWELLRSEKIDFRPHWGKHLPEANSPTGADYLCSQYPKWGAFLEVRRSMDPDGLFLSRYWKEHLDIRDPSLDYRPAKPLVDQRNPERNHMARRRHVRKPFAVWLLNLYFRLRDRLRHQPRLPNGIPVEQAG